MRTYCYLNIQYAFDKQLMCLIFLFLMILVVVES
jgi:hypothetical protein